VGTQEHQLHLQPYLPSGEEAAAVSWERWQGASLVQWLEQAQLLLALSVVFVAAVGQAFKSTRGVACFDTSCSRCLGS
jgi:hypothetical protein